MSRIPAIDLQKATVNDVEIFLALEQSVAHLKTYSAITNKKEALNEFKSSTIYFIKKDDAIVGSIEYQMKNADNAYVSGLVVEPHFQGQGIARAALTKVLEELNDIKRIDLVTHPHNTPALMLYLSLGFIIEAWKDNYFGDGEPRIMLAKIQAE